MDTPPQFRLRRSLGRLRLLSQAVRPIVLLKVTGPSLIICIGDATGVAAEVEPFSPVFRFSIRLLAALVDVGGGCSLLQPQPTMPRDAVGAASVRLLLAACRTVPKRHVVDKHIAERRMGIAVGATL